MRSTAGTIAPIERLRVSAFTVPTGRPESDGTYDWDATTLVLAELEAGGTHGTGYTYAPAAAALLVRELLEPVVVGRDAMAVRAAWDAMVRAVRNAGRPGLASHAISAVDTALWDLKARILDLPLGQLLGPARRDVPVYGSGGFTSESEAELREQLGEWAEAGIGRVKMKVGRDGRRDVARVGAAREAIGPATATTSGSSGCSSTGFPRCRTAACSRTSPRPASA